MNANQKPPPQVKAGLLLKGFVEHQLTHGDATKETTKQVVVQVKELLKQAHANGEHKKDPYRVLAVQQACDALERQALGSADCVELERAMFDAAVENHEGGPREVDLGGRKITNKKTAKEYFLRAAAVVLWEEERDLRDRLVSEARSILGISSRAALQDVVDNHNQRHGDEKRPSPLSPHIDSIKRLREAHGWTSLKDFKP